MLFSGFGVELQLGLYFKEAMANINDGEASQKNLSALFSTEFLIKRSGEQVKTQDLQDKIVGLYFSAHWCPPCRRFTPELVKVYQSLVSNGDFEIVFVSSDRDENEFKEYHQTMPWLAVPFANKDTRGDLGKVFAVGGIPHLVILGKDGNFLRDDGVQLVLEFEADAYPFTDDKIDSIKKEIELAKANQTLKSLLVSEERDFVVDKDNNQIPIAELEGKTVGLYFSAHWCGPCRNFTPQLVTIYSELKNKGEDFEIVFLSSDRDEASFTDYYNTMPWLALPFGDKTKNKLSNYFQVRGIPTLIIVGPDGKTVQTSTTFMIREYGIQAYPFTQERLLQLQAEDKAKRESATLQTLLGSDNLLINSEKKQIRVSDLNDKTVGLYFSAHWCPPCKNFTPKLVKVYNELKEKDAAFEIIFISFDRDEKSFQEYYSSMPWLTLQYGDEAKNDVARTLEVSGIPALIVAGPDGKFISFDGVETVSAYGARAYPFTESAIESLKKEADELAHKSPKEINISKHEHVLVLSETPSFTCDGCDEFIVNWSYYCKLCDYNLHIHCALAEAEKKNDKEGEEVATNGDKNDEDKANVASNEEKSSSGFVCDGDVCKRV